MNKKPSNVKFQENPPEQIEHKPHIQYVNAAEQKEQALSQFNKVQTQFKKAISQDPQCRRKDTAQALKTQLGHLQNSMQMLNIGTFEDKNKNYYLLYNATIYMFDICRILRKSVYQYIGIEYLAFCIASMEGCLTLVSVKYLDWRVKLYIELAHIYHSLQSTACAYRTIDVALQKVLELKELEEMDPPLPDYIDKILKQNLRLLRILELKFKIQGGSLNVDAWKKKIEEYFGHDKEGRSIAIIESLRLSPPTQSNTSKQNQNHLKEQLFAAGYEMLRGDMDKITMALEQQMDKIGKTVEFRQKNVLDEVERAEQTKKRRDYESGLLKDKEWRSCADGFSLEYHVELAHHAYDVNNIKAFDEISHSAFMRCKYRRIEVPYIQDVNIVISTIPNPNIPNGYDKIEVDINEASLRNELKKLRNKNKADQQQPAKRDDKKEDKKKPVEQIQQPPLVDLMGKGVQATDGELAQINHNYVYLVYKKSLTPDNAIYDIDIVMANEEDGPIDKLADGYRAIAIPIKQYTGVREKYRNIPYLIIKHTNNELQQETQKITLLVDIKPLFGKNPQIRPDAGFVKIGVDLRQIPKEFIRSPSMDYLYISYKTDKFFSIKEREVQVLMHFVQLEKTYLRDVATNIEEDARQELEICYDLNALHKLMNMISSCLVGPLGQQFLLDRKDFLNQLAFLLWRKYFLPPFYQMQFIQEQLVTQEMSKYDYARYEKWIQMGKQIFKEGLIVLNEILFNIPYTDIVLLCKVNLSLAKFLEEDKEPQVAVDNIKVCLEKLVAYRNERQKRGVDSSKDLFLPYAVTCSNYKIAQMIADMRESYVNHKNSITREMRIKQRSGLKKGQLDEDELVEEEYEVLEFQQNLLRDDNKDTHTINGIISETDLIINSIHADLVVTLYRCMVKAGADNQRRQIKKPSIEDGVDGVSLSIQKKMSIMQGDTAQTIKKNLTQLQTTLQKEGKIPAPKPLIQDYEQDIMKIANKNPYANCLLHMVLASNKSKSTEQRSLLQDSLKFLQDAEMEENIHIQDGIRDAIYVMSTLCDNIDTQSSFNKVFPYKMLYNPDYIKSQQTPRKPILISRSSDSATFKLPPFKPKLLDMIATDKAKKNITSMALFGKISANGVNVSLTCTDLNNTGTRQQIGGVVTINGLKHNEKYCFAVAGYDETEGVSNGIGETSNDICLLHPLPIPLLASYLCKTAYQLSNYDICEEAADTCIDKFTEYSDFTEAHQANPIYVRRLLQNRIKQVGVIEINNLTETLLIKAKCLQKNITNNGTPAQRHTQLLNICNYLLLGLETAICGRSFSIGKRIVGELYNMIEAFQVDKPMQVFHLLLKSQMIIVEIPKQYWDSNLRVLSAKITYEIVRISMKLNEITLGRRVIYSSLSGFNRKWYQVAKMVTVEVQDEKQPAQKKDTKKQPKQQEENVVVAPKLVPKLIREFYESNSTLQDYLEETLLSMNDDYGEFVNNFIDKWREQIEQLIPFVENPQEQIDRTFTDLTIKLEYWDTFKDLSTSFSKMSKTHPIYIEMLCKLIKRMLQSNVDYKIIIPMTQVTEPVPTSVQIGNDIIALQMKCIDNDIEYYPAILPELVQEKLTNKVGNDIAIEIFEQYLIKKEQLIESLKLEGQQLNRFHTMSRCRRFEYVNLWRSDLSYLKGVLAYKSNRICPVQPDSFISVYSLDIEHLQELSIDQVTRKQTPEQPKVVETQPKQQQPPAAGKGKGAAAAVVQQPEMSEQEEQLQTTQQVIRYISEACAQAVYCKQYLVMLNQLKFLYNFLLREQISPFMHKGHCWSELVLIANCINTMIREIKSYGVYQYKEQLEVELQLRAHLPQNEYCYMPPLPSVEPIRPALLTQLSKDCWFSKFKDMELLANIMAYILQCLLIEQKWNSLIGVSREFCNLTTHYYSQYILPFTIHAQTILFKQAQQATMEKNETLNQRTLAFQNWEQTKKKKTRSSMLTQEVPQEEIDFKADREMYLEQIKLLQSKQDFIEGQLKISEKLIAEINRDANQALEGLKQARKLFEKFALDEESLAKESGQIEFNQEQQQIKLLLGEKQAKQGAVQDQMLKIKRKNHKQFGMQVISKYKLTVELLHKRQEKFAQAVALKELGSLNYAMQNYAQAEESWNESLDTIFQRIFILKNSAYRQVLTDCEKSGQLVAQQYGVQQCLIAVNLCSLLAYHCYHNNCHQQREAALMASEMVASVMKLQLVNGSDWAQFITAKEVSIGAIFNDRYTLDPAELALSCERIAWLLIDRDEPLRAVPVITLLGELSNRLQSHYYSVRAKLLKSIALSMVGYINQGYQCLVKVASEKDLPDQSQSLWQSKMNGKWWYSNIEWNNSLPPYDEKHVQLCEQFIKDLQLTKVFGLKYGLQNENLFNYALALLIQNIHCGDIVEKWEINEFRCKMLSKVETIFRTILKKLHFEEQLEQHILTKSKEDTIAFAKQNGVVDADFDGYFQLMGNTKPIGVTNNQEYQNYVQKREERLLMMSRCRHQMAKLNLSMGLTTRCLYIYKVGIENMFSYSLEGIANENGEEIDNPPLDTLKPQGIIDDKKGAKKAADKKPGKEVQQKQQQEEGEPVQKTAQELRFEEVMMQTVDNRKLRRSPSIYWWIKLRVELIVLLQRHNRIQEAVDLMEGMISDCKQFNDNYHQRVLVEVQARLHLRSGKITECLQKYQEAIDISFKYYHHDAQLAILHGDFGEILVDRNELQEAKHQFHSAYRITEALMSKVNYGYGVVQNWNSKSGQEGIKVCQELCVPLEVEQEIMKKADKNQKQSKKDDKKPKDDGKVVRKGADKNQAKKESVDKPQMPVKPMNTMPNYNFTQQPKYTYQNLDIDVCNNMQHQYNCYLKYVDLWQRSALRYVDIMIILNPAQEHSNVTIDSQESSMISDSESQASLKVQQFDINSIMEILQQIDTSIQKSINVPISFRLELYLLYSKTYKMKFIQLLLDLQQKYMHKYLSLKNKKYADFYDKRPNRDLIRNKYFLGIPPYCKMLKEQGLPQLQLAKDSLKKAISVIRGEAVLFEYNRKPEEILLGMVEICLLQREYRNRVGFRHLRMEQLQQMINEGEDTKLDIEQTLSGLEKDDKLEQLNLELEAQTYQKYAIEIVKARIELCDNFATVGLNPLTDVSKLSYEIFTEIVEQDYIYKKQYPTMLFDESKKKLGVTSIDVLLYLQKAWRESKMLTFSNPHLQRIISKAHRFLKLQMQSYQKCLLNSIEVAPKNDINAVFIDDGSVVVKLIFDKLLHEYKFIYIIGALNKDKLINSLPKEDKELIANVSQLPLLQRDESHVLYGSIYISDGNLSILLQEALDLQGRMQESDKQPQKFKERDYKHHKRAFYKLIEQFGMYFFQKPTSISNHKKTISPTKKTEIAINYETSEVDLLDKYGVLVPELTHENIGFLIHMFNDIGVSAVNHNYLAIMRFLHYQKYR